MLGRSIIPRRTLTAQPPGIYLGSLWLAAFYLTPMALILSFSVLQIDEMGDISYQWTPKNYVEIFTGSYGQILRRSFRIGLFASFLSTVLSFVCAFYAYKNPRRVVLISTVMLLPYLTNFLIRSYAWIGLLGRNGMVNETLLTLGLIKEPMEMLFSGQAIILGFVYNLLPFSFFPLLLAFRSLDTRLELAASDLGASQMHWARYVMIPLIAPGLVASFMLTLLPAFGDFIIPEIFGGGRVLLLGNLIKSQFLSARNWPLGSAMASFLLALSFIGFKMTDYASRNS